MAKSGMRPEKADHASRGNSLCGAKHRLEFADSNSSHGEGVASLPINARSEAVVIESTSEKYHDRWSALRPDQSGRQFGNLKRNIVWAFGGNSFYGLCQWGMLTILARLGRPEQVGTYALGVAISTPMFMLSNLHLREIQSTDTRQQFKFGQYVGLRLATTAIALLAIGAVAYAAGFKREAALVVLLVAMARGVESIADVFYGLLQRYERLDRISKSLILHGSLLVLGLGVVFWFKRALPWGVACSVLGGILALSYDIRSPRLVGENADSWTIGPWRTTAWIQATLRLAWLGLPLGSVMALVTLSANIPRYFIEKYYGPKELGIFAAMAYFMLVGTLVVTAMGQSASPRLARYFFGGNHTAFVVLLRKLLSTAVVLGVAGVALAAVAAGPALRVFYGPEYAVHSGVLVWLMLASGISYIVGFLGFAMVAIRRLAILFPIFLLASAISFLGCFLLVPKFGMVGAALAIVASTATQAIGTGAVVYGTLARVRSCQAQLF
jgi:O-antigen/teichoic acid export membrane protein